VSLILFCSALHFFSVEGQYSVTTSVKRVRALLFKLNRNITLNLVYGTQKVRGKFDINGQNM